MSKKSWRYTKKWRDIRYKRLELDNYQCQICKDNKRLDVHHIEDASYHQNLRYDINNLITLCHKCHFSMYHILFKGGTRRKTTKKDFKKFKAIANYYMKKT